MPIICSCGHVFGVVSGTFSVGAGGFGCIGLAKKFVLVCTLLGKTPNELLGQPSAGPTPSHGAKHVDAAPDHPWFRPAPWQFLLMSSSLCVSIQNNASKLLLAIMESRHDSENAERILYNMRPKELVSWTTEPLALALSSIRASWEPEQSIYFLELSL